MARWRNGHSVRIATNREFDYQPFHCHVMIPVKLFTHVPITKQYNLVVAQGQ